MNWFMFLLSKNYRKEYKLRKEHEILQQFEQLYTQLELNYHDLNKSLWHPELKIGKYGFTGGWLSRSFYLDVSNKKDMGRIYIGPNLFSSDLAIRWHSCSWDTLYLSTSDKIDRVNLAEAINSLIPGLIKLRYN